MLPLSFVVISVTYLLISYSPYLSKLGLSYLRDYLALSAVFVFVSLFLYYNPERVTEAFISGGIIFYIIKTFPSVFFYGHTLFVTSLPSLFVYVALAVIIYFLHLILLRLVNDNSVVTFYFLLAIFLLGSFVFGYLNVHDLGIQYRIIPSVTKSGNSDECKEYIVSSYRRSCESYIRYMKTRYPDHYQSKLDSF